MRSQDLIVSKIIQRRAGVGVFGQPDTRLRCSRLFQSRFHTKARRCGGQRLRLPAEPEPRWKGTIRGAPHWPWHRVPYSSAVRTPSSNIHGITIALLRCLNVEFCKCTDDGACTEEDNKLFKEECNECEGAAGAFAQSITASIRLKRGAFKGLDEGPLAVSKGGVIGIQRCQR